MALFGPRIGLDKRNLQTFSGNSYRSDDVSDALTVRARCVQDVSRFLIQLQKKKKISLFLDVRKTQQCNVWVRGCCCFFFFLEVVFFLNLRVGRFLRQKLDQRRGCATIHALLWEGVCLGKQWPWPFRFQTRRLKILRRSYSEKKKHHETHIARCQEELKDVLLVQNPASGVEEVIRQPDVRHFGPVPGLEKRCWRVRCLLPVSVEYFTLQYCRQFIF